MENKTYKELQEIASEKGLKSVGVKREVLIENIIKFNDEKEKEVTEVEKEVETVDNSEETVDNSEKRFNKKIISSVTNKLINGKSFKEVSVVSGEVFFVTNEEFENGSSK